MISFGTLATFLEKALASKDSAIWRLDVLAKVLQCAREESRRQMSLPPEVPEIAGSLCSQQPQNLLMSEPPLQPLPVSEVPSIPPPQKQPDPPAKRTVKLCDVDEAVCMLTQVLMGPSFDSRESLGALLALKHLMDVEPSAAPALRRVSGVQRALCDFRSGVNTTLPFAADNRRRKLAAEIEKVCFDSH